MDFGITAVIFLYKMYCLVFFITEKAFVYCAVRTQSLTLKNPN